MRDCFFLLADKNMQAAFEGFLTRQRCHASLGCGAFEFDHRIDILVAAGDNDPGLYTRGHELLRPFQSSHHQAVVVLDAEWDGSPGADAIRQHMTQQITASGWDNDRFRVIVIEPELENWIWQKSDHVARGLGFENHNELILDPDMADAWPEGCCKPIAPKEAMEHLLRKKRIPRSSSIYKDIASSVSIRHCEDAAFQMLLETLREWFPRENGG
ncbi:hypothetical protein [Thiolapillus sp.]|uniref:methylation-associated defense system protein MAD4 n=1 Tax=Thiolapillus sp. TaxID=2017437 RepID=UPI0025DD154A|nr:hypothetical protein [Thiolapillus sp.]